MMPNENEFRCRFFCEGIAASILHDPTPFYEAVEDGEDGVPSLLTAWWEIHCDRSAQSIADHPFFPEIATHVLEDTEEGFCALTTVVLPKTAHASRLTAVIVFGSAMDPRVFITRPVMLKNGETVSVCECRANGEIAVGTLFQGCDNGMQLFDAPTPQKIDRDTPLEFSRREDALLDMVVCWCLTHD